ncbi:cysteine hydrolase [Candidatus Dependentiae bacterium]|nr:cysteine hydrolase [Candidatus Dependentiae bacterium]
MIENSALLVIDMQNDFVKNESSPVYIPGSVKIIKNILAVKNFFKSNFQIIIHVVTEHSSEMKYWGKKDIELNRKYCIENTSGAEIIKELKDSIQNEIIVKKKFYSGFYDTDLKKKLKNYKIENLYFSGLTTGCCVSSTARDAYNFGYNLFFIRECMTSSSEDSHNNELFFFQKSLGRVVSLSDLINL